MMLALITQFTQIVHVLFLFESYAQNKSYYKAGTHSSWEKKKSLAFQWNVNENGIQILKQLLTYHQLQGTCQSISS